MDRACLDMSALCQKRPNAAHKSAAIRFIPSASAISYTDRAPKCSQLLVGAQLLVTLSQTLGGVKLMFATFGAEIVKNELLLIARVLIVLLYVIFGWQKLTDYDGTFAYFTHEGVPSPYMAVWIAVIMELGVGIALILGFLTRPLALLLALYTLATAIIGHHFWTMSGMERVEAEINL